MKIGVVALQGDVAEHLAAWRTFCEAVEIRKPSDCESIAGLSIPGGESTTISKLLSATGLDKKIISLARTGLPILGTCAGAILLAKTVRGLAQNQKTLGLMDIVVNRNAYGRQAESFEEEVEVENIGKFPGVFIRAPRISKVTKLAEVFARHGREIVGARQGSLVALTFHPELSGNLRLHKLFVQLCEAYQTRRLAAMD